MKKGIETALILAIFIGINIVAHSYEAQLESLAHQVGFFGIIFYVVTTALAIIIPIWSNVFLIPVASAMWGPFATALLSIFGWLIGSQVSFLIGRYFEARVMKAFPSLAASNYVDRLVSRKHPNLSLIFLRMTIPVDILSYGLGLFAHHVSARQNFFTTLIGITPFAFVFSYFNDVPKMYTGTILVCTTTLFFVYSAVMLKGK